MKRAFHPVPGYLVIIAANALPIYGAATGKLVFFQVIYLYWVESLLLIFFYAVRIMAARGNRQVEGGVIMKLQNAISGKNSELQERWNFFKRIGLVLRTAVVRTLILLFYMVFIIAFVVLQVTGKAHRVDVWETVLFRNEFFNLSLAVFFINAVVQLIAGFFMNGNYRVDSPRAFTAPFDGRTLLMHVMIIGSTFMHQFIFAGTAYVSRGEIVYIGLFMLIKTLADIAYLRARMAADPEGLVMI